MRWQTWRMAAQRVATVSGCRRVAPGCRGSLDGVQCIGWLSCASNPATSASSSYSRAFSNKSGHPKFPRAARVGADLSQDPERLFQQARKQLAQPNDNFLNYGWCNDVVFANLRRHEDPTRGLHNAIEVAHLAVQRQQGYLVPRKTWNSMLLKMIELQFPMQEMIHWVDAQPVQDLTKEMLYVLANALEHLHQVDIVLGLLQHYVQTAQAKADRTYRDALLNHLVEPFLNAKPRIRQLEMFLTIMQSCHTPARATYWSKILLYYLEPWHHEPGRTLNDIASSFLGFVQANRYVLRWHSSLSPVKSNQAPVREVQQQLENFMTMSAKEREEYSMAVAGALKDPDRLYALAQEKATSAPAPLDYDLFTRAVFANAHDRKSPELGLFRAVEIARSVRGRPGFELPPETWNAILLKMIETQCPLEDVTNWIDTQPVVNLSKSMIYVLSNALKDRTDPCRVLDVLSHYLQKAGAKRQREDRCAVLGYLLDLFMSTAPNGEQLDRYLSFLRADRCTLTKSQKGAIISSFLNLLQHEDKCSPEEMTVRFLRLWNVNQVVFMSTRHRQARESSLQGSLLGGCGQLGVSIAKELLTLDDGGVKDRLAFATAVVRALACTDEQAHAEFVRAVDVMRHGNEC